MGRPCEVAAFSITPKAGQESLPDVFNMQSQFPCSVQLSSVLLESCFKTPHTSLCPMLCIGSETWPRAAEAQSERAQQVIHVLIQYDPGNALVATKHLL